jgi:hypothetical protein
MKSEANKNAHYNFEKIRKTHGGAFPMIGDRIIFENGTSILITSNCETLANVVKVRGIVNGKEMLIGIRDLFGMGRIKSIE